MYGTIFKSIPENNIWNTAHEGTFADYFGIHEGDNVYFFIERKVYGIGKLIKLKYDCKYKNFPQSLIPRDINFKDVKKNVMIGDSSNNTHIRCFCVFKPNPHFFKQGIDMDEILVSNPKSFKMLRAFWKLSFIKIDDIENKALKDIIFKKNKDAISTPGEAVFSFDDTKQKRIQNKIDGSYILNSEEIVAHAIRDDEVKHEMAIECAIMENIFKKETIFGKWDYVSHQVIASPFKPIDYMDKMDIFGYRKIKYYETIINYLLIEIKKDCADLVDINQTMKYVDWINQEYAYGDYSMIEAFLVAKDFSQDCIRFKKDNCIRFHTTGNRPIKNEKWTNLKLIKYGLKDGKIYFKEII